MYFLIRFLEVFWLKLVLFYNFIEVKSEPQTDFRVVKLSSLGIVRETVNIGYNRTGIMIIDLRGISWALKGPVFSIHSATTLLYFISSRFDLYDDQEKPLSSEDCSYDNFENRTVNFFSHFTDVKLYIKVNGNYFPRPVCPYLFKNAAIGQLIFENVGNTYIAKNMVSFYDIVNSNNRTISIECKLGKLTYSNIYRSVFKFQFATTYIFEKATELQLEGILNPIDHGFFKTFRNLEAVDITAGNMAEFFQASNNEWLADVFNQYESFPTRLTMEMNFLDTKGKILNWRIVQTRFSSYEFPDEDFCLLKYFPKYKPIYSIIHYENRSMKYLIRNIDSCTVRFLCESNGFFKEIYRRLKYVPPEANNFSVKMLDDCQFKEKLSMCFNVSTQIRLSEHSSHVYYLDVLYVFNWIELLGPIFTFPIFSAIAFILNLLIILVIRGQKSKKEKLFDAKLFRFIELNSAFNCIECLIYQFRLMGICLGTNSIFCSSIRDFSLVYYFEASARYLGEVMKTCSIVTGLFFSMQRFIDTSKNPNQLLKRFSEITMRRLFFYIILYGLIFTIPFTFGFRTSSTIVVYDIPDIFYLNHGDFELQKIRTFFYFAYYLTNDLVILGLNLAVDYCLVCHIKSDLKRKAYNRQKHRSVDFSSSSKLENSKLNEEKKKEKFVERKANIMIIINVIIYVCCRLPELAGVFIYYNIYELFTLSNCSFSIFCFLLSNYIEYLYMMSYIFNIVLYYKFNTHFQRGFLMFFGLKKILPSTKSPNTM